MTSSGRDPDASEVRAWLAAVAASARAGTFPLDLRVRLGWTPEQVKQYADRQTSPAEIDLFAIDLRAD